MSSKNIVIFDKVPIKETTTRMVTDEGYLVLPDCRLAKPGIMKYLGAEVGDEEPEKVFNVYRSPTELFDADTIASFRSKPLTFTHQALVNPDNVNRVIAGVSKDDVRQEEGFLRGSLVVFEDRSIKAVQDKEAEELSLGYTAKFTKVSGFSPEGESYDYIMSGIRGNHVAIVPRGRNGRECRVADGEPKHKERKMETQTIVLDGENFTVPAPVAQMLADLRVQADEVTLDKAKLESEKDRLQAVADAAQAEIENLKGQASPERVQQLAASRVKLIDQARQIVADYDATGKDEAKVIEEILASKSIATEGKSEEYRKARFEILVEDSVKEGYRKFAATSDESKEQKSWRQKRQERINGKEA